MKRRAFYQMAVFAVASIGFMASCGEDPVEPTAELPVADGTVQISFRNIPGNDPQVSVGAGDVVAVSLLIEKAANGTRPQKLRIYETNALNTRGTQVKVEGQGDNAGTIDLRNVDSQTKTIDYTVPTTANGTTYLYFEVDESGGKFSRKVLRVNVGAAGTFAGLTDVKLGAQSNTEFQSRMSSSTGYVYFACEVAANISYIDITFAASNQNANYYLSSNPARFSAPIGLTLKSTNCGEEGTLATDGGTATYFSTATAADFTNATDATLSALNVPSTNQFVPVVKGGYYSFLNSKGKKGIVYVKDLTGTGPNAVITVDVKVQR